CGGPRSLDPDPPAPREFESCGGERRLILRHGPAPTFVTRANPFLLDHALVEIEQWLSRPAHRNEIIFLDFEDSTEQAERFADDPLIPHLLDHFGTQIYRPDE